MDNKSLATRLRQMAVNTGTLNCLGCGYEHSCSTRGCAVLKNAAEIVEKTVFQDGHEKLNGRYEE